MPSIALITEGEEREVDMADQVNGALIAVDK